MSHLGHVVRARWWVILALALLNTWVAGYLTDLRNQQMPDWEAVAPIGFSPRIGEVGEEPVLTRLEESAAAAQEANQDLIGQYNGLTIPWSKATIEVDERGRRLLFTGRGDTPQEAEGIADALRQAFVQEGFLDEARLVEIQRQLDQILGELAALRRRIDAATAPEPIDPEEELHRSLLTDQINALRGRYAALSAQRFNPPEGRTVSGIEAEMADIRAQLVALQTELRSLPALPGQEEGEAPPEESLPLTVDRLQYEQLQGVYQELYLRSLEAEAQGTTEPILVQASTLQPASKPVNQALGALVGLAAAIIGLVVADRVRGSLWAGADAEDVAVLETLPPRPVWAPLDRPWYLRAPPGPRKASVQRFRSLIEGMNGDRGLTVGIAGISVRPEDIHELAADLAVSLAVSGRKVLLVDANIDRPSRLMEFGTHQITLSELLRVPLNGRQEVASQIESMLLQAPEIVTNLVSLPAGRKRVDAADTLSRPQLEILVESARGLFDLVIVAGDEASEPSAHVLAQRLQALVLLGAAGRTTVAGAESVTRELGQRRASVLGMLLLTASPGGLRRAFTRLLARAVGTGRMEEADRRAGATEEPVPVDIRPGSGPE